MASTAHAYRALKSICLEGKLQLTVILRGARRAAFSASPNLLDRFKGKGKEEKGKEWVRQRRSSNGRRRKDGGEQEAQLSPRDRAMHRVS